MWDFWKHGKSAGSSGNLPQCATAGADPTEVGKAALKDSRAPRELRKLASKVVSFKDLHVFMDDPLNLAPGETDSDEAQPGGSSPRHAPGRLVRAYSSTRETAIEKTKLVIIMVGLPGRGKTFLCNKIKGYLNWLGHNTAHFNVGQYRRQYKASNELQDANFFDHKNLEGLTAREAACDAALSDVLKYLDSDTGQVAIFDATNSTVERRSKLICAFHGRYKYLFLESICNDVEVLQQNYVSKMKFSPDYQGVDMEQALADFKVRIRKYEQVYEPITDRELQYIKLTDMVTGRGYLDVNRISGYIPGKLVFFLMQACRAGLGNSRKIWLTRHGESEFNQKSLLGGDSALSHRGEEYAKMLPELLLNRLPKDEEGLIPVAVWTSTLRRTIMTARHLPLAKLRWKVLDEIDAGICDGMSYEEIAIKYPNEFAARKKDKLRYRYPQGESYLDVIQRLEPVITEIERGRESMVIVAHQAILRVIYGYLMARHPEDIPRIDIPLHTLIELTPLPDGTMKEERIVAPVATSHPHHCAAAVHISIPEYIGNHGPIMVSGGKGLMPGQVPTASAVATPTC